jgi:sugar (pentulose or hexulose) kinase
MANRVQPGSNGLIHLPYFQGQRSPEFDPRATGVFFGMKSTHTRAHFFRALLESWGYSIMAVGIFPDFVHLQNDWVHTEAVTEPNPEAHKIYDRYYPVYVELHSTLKPLNEHLHTIQISLGA